MKQRFFTALFLVFTFTQLTYAQVYRIDYRITFPEKNSRDTALAPKSEQDHFSDNLQLLMTGGDEPLLKAWVHQSFSRVHSIFFGESIQITNKQTEDSFLLNPQLQTFMPVEAATEQIDVLEQNDDIMVISTEDFPIDFSSDSIQIIQGYTCKLAVMSPTMDESSMLQQAPQIAIWYTSDIPQLYWGEYAYLKRIPGAALSIGMTDNSFALIAHEIQVIADDSTLFQVPQHYTLEEEIAATEEELTIALGENRFAYTDASTDLVGIVDSLQQVILEPTYTAIHLGNKHYAAAMDSTLMYGIIDLNGKPITNFEYDYIELSTDDDVAVFTHKEYSGLMDIKGNILYKDVFASLSAPQNGVSIFSKDLEKYGVMDKSANIIVEPHYELIAEAARDYTIIIEDQAYFLINNKTKQRLPRSYDYIANANKENLFIVYDGEHYGYMHADGSIIIPLQYSYATTFEQDVAQVIKAGDDEYSHINANGDLVDSPPTAITP